MKCFDHCQPGLITRCLDWLGALPQITRLCSTFWTHQQRFVAAPLGILSRPHRVSTSMPQGDAFSPLGLNALLLAPSLFVVSVLRQGEELVSLLDDRNMLVQTWQRLQYMVRLWNTWLLVLGLIENLQKLKVVRERASLPVPDKSDPLFGCLVMEVRVLGIDFRARQFPKQYTTTVLNRVVEAVARIERIAILRPQGWPLQREYIRSLALSKAAWGWWLRAPPRYVQLIVQHAIQRATARWHGGTSTALRSLLRGFDLDLGFVAGLQAMRYLFAAQAAAQQAGEVVHGGSRWDHRVRDWLLSLGARTVEVRQHHERVWRLGEMEWTFSTWKLRRAAIEHQLREQWRRQLWDRFIRSHRRDASVIGATEEAAYDERTAKAATQMYLRADLHQRRVLEGGSTSLARVAIWNRQRLLRCPWCEVPAAPSWQHLAWACTACRAGRPPRPSTIKQQLLGWPAAVTSAAWSVLQHLGRIRERVLSSRYRE
jgi:hypothetical protein